MDCLLRMLGSLVQEKPCQHTITKGILRKHPVERRMEHLPRVLLHLILESDGSYSSGIAAEMVIHLPFALVSGHLQSIGIDNNDEIATVDMRRIVSLDLPGKHAGYFRRKPPQDFPLSVKEVIFPMYLSCHTVDLDKFDYRHLRAVTLPGFELHDPSITARTNGESGDEFRRKKLLDRHERKMSSELADGRDPFRLVGGLLGLIHKLIDLVLELLRLGFGGLDALVYDKTPEHRFQKCPTLVSPSTQYSS